MASDLGRNPANAASTARFRRDTGGNVAIVFAVSVTVITVALGGAFDLSRAFSARQRLVEVATLACQYASRPSVIQTDAWDYSGSNGGATYSSKVTGFIASSLQGQKFQYAQTTPSPFTYIQNGPANVSLTASVPTTLMQVAQIMQVPISASIHCYDSPSNLTQIVNTPFIVQETFANQAANCANGPGSVCYINQSGAIGAPATPSATFPGSPSYIGATGIAWYVTGYCLEIDASGVISASDPGASHSAELNCDDGTGGSADHGNSALTTKVYLEAGDYELRYFYRSRVDYPDYDPAYICGSTASDVSFANDTNSSGAPVANALRNNQLEAYLDEVTGSSPPLHTTTDGTQHLAGSNLIDICVYGYSWLERSVRVVVSTPAYYWLTFAADGQNDSFGGQLDNIRFCQGTCSGTVQDNFPTNWLAANNSWVNKVLFEDTFESPTYSGNVTAYASNAGNMNNSLGTSGSASSGWPGLAASGWATAPYNDVNYNLAPFSVQGSQSIELDGYVNPANNSSINRGFLLDPGYYQVSYYYVSDAIFAGMTSPACTAAPSAAAAATYVVSGTASAVVRFSTNFSYLLGQDTNTVGVFMSHGQLVSTPIGGGALGSQTSYNNPDGTISTNPTTPPSQVSLSNYNPGQNNPLLDICGYASSWQARTAYIEITKPAYYWLTIAALGSADEIGGAIDDVKLTALGSLYMTSPPANAVTIPVPGPQPGVTLSFNGFEIIADPLTAPAPEQ
jgi:Flp pilus assembly protein TadG